MINNINPKSQKKIIEKKQRYQERVLSKIFEKKMNATGCIQEVEWKLKFQKNLLNKNGRYRIVGTQIHQQIQKWFI